MNSERKSRTFCQGKSSRQISPLVSLTKSKRESGSYRIENYPMHMQLLFVGNLFGLTPAKPRWRTKLKDPLKSSLKEPNVSINFKCETMIRLAFFKVCLWVKVIIQLLTGSHDEMNEPSSLITEKIEDSMHSLQEKHGESSYQPYQYRLWAEMLAWID